MVYVNHGGKGHNPFHAHDGSSESGIFTQDPSGMHQRVDRDNYHLEVAFGIYREQPNRGLSLAAYQHWTELSWKTPHGDYDTVLRFNAKLEEEMRELLEALETDDTKEICSEIGDVLWLVNATAANSAVDVEGALKPLLYKYCMGVTHINRTDPDPLWRAQAVSLASSSDRLSFSDIDQLIVAGFEPLPSTAMNLYDDDPNMSVDEVTRDLVASIWAIQSLTERQRLYGEQEVCMGSDYLQIARELLGPNCALAILQLAYIAHQRGSTLSQSVAKNIHKLEGRLSAQLIDKSDGARPEDLL